MYLILYVGQTYEQTLNSSLKLDTDDSKDKYKMSYKYKWARDTET